MDTHPVMADGGDHESYQITVQAMREVFGVKPLDQETGKGLTEWEVMSLLGDFIDWLDSLKKL